jgi:hypothetical protein
MIHGLQIFLAAYNKMTPNTNTELPVRILTRAFFGNRVIPGKYIGGGVNGKVYETNNNRVIKFILGPQPKEYLALEHLQSTHTVPSFRPGNGKVMKLTPKLMLAAREMFKNNYNNDTLMTAIIMGKVGGANPMTLKRYVNTHPGTVNKADITRRVRHILDQMGSKGISHGNFHYENIIVQVGPSGKIVRMWAIDFGRAIRLPLNKTPINILKTASGRTHSTRSLYNRNRALNVPLVGTMKHRIDPHMAQALGVQYLANNVHRIAGLRRFVHNEVAKLPNSPRRVTTPSRRAKSATPARRAKSATPARRPRTASK